MITVCTNKDMYIQKVFNNNEFTDLKTNIIVPAGTEFIVNDIIIDRSDDRLGTSHTAFLCENEEYDIIDYINLDDIEEKC